MYHFCSNVQQVMCFIGRDDDPEVVKAKIEDTFPQLKDTGGFELLRISGTTRSVTCAQSQAQTLDIQCDISAVH